MFAIQGWRVREGRRLDFEWMKQIGKIIIFLLTCAVEYDIISIIKIESKRY